MPIKTPHEISLDYYQFIDEFTQSDFEDEKLLGKFYTDYDIAGSMMRMLGQCYVCETFSSELRIIDPFCGDGRLVISLLSELRDLGKLASKRLFISIWDIDANAVEIAKCAITQFCESAGLQYELDARQADAFVEYYAVRGKYDICVTNPPWSILKPQKLLSKSNSEEAMVRYRNAIEQYDSFMKESFAISQPSSKFGKWGTNLARCGTEVALRLMKSSGFCGIVSPASLLNDQVSNRLRNWIFENYKVMNISYYPAELKLYGSADISSTTIVLNGGETDQSLSVRIYNDKNTYKEKKIEKAIFEYIKRTGFCFPLKTGIEAIPIMMYLEQLPSTNEFCSATGLSFTRELDETRVKEKLLPTGRIEFAKGYMVDRYSFTSGQMFLNEEMVISPTSSFMSKVVWRDVSRDSQVRRIKATLLPPGFICGNSLGVIYGDEATLLYLKMLLAIMNSMIFEYQARSMLVSNHVSAGIVKQIRVPQPSVDMNIIELVDKQLAGQDVEDDIELAVAHLYNLSPDEYEIIVDSFKLDQEKRANIIRQYREKSQDGEKKTMIFNHYASSLSELDMQVIKCVPPGGNWKNIPESVPSQRVAQIRESYKAGKGSRSTYYGRLRPDMPAYTINTYFNRPGNGCHMHYDQDRTISQREAARFQSFPDSFEFIGSLGAINNQIGNAVPPLLAYQIAKNIPFKGQFVDLFCGAGGLALGFIWAGWKPIIGNDIDKYAVETHKRNLDGEAIVGDINSQEVHNAIVNAAIAAKKANPNLPLFVLGGPPCQGFSTANTRRGVEDMRNWLFKSYASIVKAIKPDGFVFENVRGILNLDKGNFFEMIKAELKECVAEIKVNQVSAANFGVPQRRDRVIILGGDDDFVKGFSINEISCVPKGGQLSLLPSVISVEDAIGDLPSLQPGEDGSGYNYRFPAANFYQKFMRGEITADEYLDSYL
ncbi:Alw26I/Eco31I/Esp3I family type II restriction adenine-specific DNA-methyltransferase [Anaerovibrio sp.]|uniref:Alw26I/Eco31I/Esp3I family type II restriction adenine-specific DNA-methyltransferase n=1 Tax=Anaerovibrio sp. TaxID=1872532 RepID=UPI00261BD928|nr:Alw26I/Eco31I/Esp3I family type II restriction adenine-specific DNA-methyltransferase [Anaerovibrio sp.]MDD6597159.1 Alw26I/Eco31I/Esp3I family type II restriction adenine-specific DNA-methyltransferase [Anaerovibrio sp.]